MSDVANKQVSIFIDQSAAEASLEKLQGKADGFNKKIDDARIKQKALREEIEKTAAAGGSTTKLETQYKSLEKEIVSTTAKVNDNKVALQKVQEQIDKGLRPSFAQQERLVISLRNQLKQMSEDAPGYAAKFKAFQNASGELDRMKVAMNGVEKAQTSWLQQAKVVAFGVVIGNTIQSAIAAIGNYLSGIVSGNAKLSDSLADLRRVAGLTNGEVSNLYKQLRSIDTRTSTSGLLNIAIIAGKLGVAKTDIAGFTEAVDKLQVALGDELGDADQITTQLGKILNVFDGQVNADNITKVGNAIVDLANKGVASGSFLVDFAQRVSGVAKASNLALPDVLGLAAGLEESGAKVESSSTAIQKLLTDIGTDIPKAAKIAGVDVKEFNALFAEKPQEALLQYAAGLQKNKASFAEVASSFKDAGEDGARTIAVLATLGQKTDFFRQKMQDAGQAIKNTDQIQNAFNLKNETLGASLDKLGKRIGALFTNSALTKFFTGIATAASDALEPVKSLTEQFNQQQKEVDNLQKNIIPLANRYDELKGKTKLSKDEQAEMKAIIGQITAVIPGAVTQFDQYGNAIAISTTRVREFIDAEKARLKVVNADAIKENQKALQKINQDLAIEQRTLDEIAKTGTFKITTQITGSSTGTGGSDIVENADQKSIAAAQQHFKDLKEQQLGYQTEIKRLNGQFIDDIQKAQDDANKKTEGTFTVEKTKEEKAAEKKYDDARKKFQEFLKGIDDDAAKSGLPSDMQQIVAAATKYFEQLKTLTDGFSKGFINKADLQKRMAEIEAIYKDAVHKLQKEDPPTIDIVPQLKEEDFDNVMKQAQNFLKKLQIDNDNAFFLDIVNAKSFQEKRAAEIAYLEWQKQQELDNTNLTERQKAEIIDKYRKLEEQIDIDHWQRIYQAIQDAVDQTSKALQVWSTFSEAQTNKENAAFTAEVARNDKARQAYQRMLNGKLLTQAEYNRKVGALDASEEKKKEELEKKQFERNRRIQIATAGINIAQGILTDIRNYGAPIPPNFLSIAAVALDAALGIAQIAAINKSKPQYGKGGLLEGPSHDNGGITLIDRSTGKAFAEAEGGEPLLSKATYKNNKPLVDALLHNSMYNGGASIEPNYFTRTYRPVAAGSITQTYQTMKFASGGVLPGSSSATGAGATTDPLLLQTLIANQQSLSALANTVSKLENRLSKPIDANVSLKKLSDAENQNARILNDAVFQ